MIMKEILGKFFPITFAPIFPRSCRPIFAILHQFAISDKTTQIAGRILRCCLRKIRKHEKNAFEAEEFRVHLSPF